MYWGFYIIVNSGNILWRGEGEDDGYVDKTVDSWFGHNLSIRLCQFQIVTLKKELGLAI